MRITQKKQQQKKKTNNKPAKRRQNSEAAPGATYRAAAAGAAAAAAVPAWCSVRPSPLRLPALSPSGARCPPPASHPLPPPQPGEVRSIPGPPSPPPPRNRGWGWRGGYGCQLIQGDLRMEFGFVVRAEFCGGVGMRGGDLGCLPQGGVGRIWVFF